MDIGLRERLALVTGASSGRCGRCATVGADVGVDLRTRPSQRGDVLALSYPCLPTTS